LTADVEAGPVGCRYI